MINKVCTSALLALLALPVTAEQPNPAVADVQALLQKHDAAMNAHDLDGVMATFSDHPTTLMLGTGPGEVWVGKAEITEAYRNFIADFEAGTATSDCGWQVIDVQSDTAWFAAMCQMSDSLEGNKREFAFNVSALLVREDAQWRLRMLHASNLIAAAAQE